MYNKKIDIIIDTDTFAEIDDQFSLAFTFANRELFDIKAITCAPFFDTHVSSIEEGMQKSCAEALKICELMELERDFDIHKGATKFMDKPSEPISSNASCEIIKQALIAKSQGKKIHIIAIAALTNIASALVENPEIANSMAIYWLGGQEYSDKEPKEYNLSNDLIAAQIVFASECEIVQFPCRNVCEKLVTTMAGLEKILPYNSSISQYLKFIFQRHLNYRNVDFKVLWDMAVPAYFICHDALEFVTIKRHLIADDYRWYQTTDNKTVKVLQNIDKKILFSKFSKSMA